MTVKQFVRSEAFKCIVVLLAIALVAGGLLAILNDVLAVSAEERTMRAIESVVSGRSTSSFPSVSVILNICSSETAFSLPVRVS